MTRAEMRQEAVDLTALATSVAAELTRTAPGRHVTFEIEPGMTATGDVSLLRIVLENLLGNAWKFTSRRPEARITVGRTTRDGCPAFFVRDTGAGFDMAYAGKLFGAFQRLHGAGEFAGTGIGLATVQRIVRRHGGEVWAEGAVGQGATLTFSLPGAPPPQGAEP
jgi:light-regulated signal transduction histidine kinase (bacteriophytochrome)